MLGTSTSATVYGGPESWMLRSTTGQRSGPLGAGAGWVVVVVGGGGFSTIARYSGSAGAACPHPVSATNKSAASVQRRRTMRVVFATLSGLPCVAPPKTTPKARG